jgi:Anti-sigma-K factor rskA, C-terminal
MNEHDDFEGEELSDADLAVLSGFLGDAAVWDEPDPALEDRVVEAIRTEAIRTRAAERGPVLEDVDAGEGAPAAPIRSRRAGGRRLRLVAAVAAAAVVVIAAVGIVRLATSSGDNGVLLALAPTDLAPADSSVDVRIDERPNGTRLLLDLSRVPPAPAGSYYEAWLRQSPEVGVSAGTFHMRGGDGRVELWSGVSPDDYPLVTITLQDEGGGGDSSGVVFYAGRLG